MFLIQSKMIAYRGRHLQTPSRSFAQFYLPPVCSAVIQKLLSSPNLFYNHQTQIYICLLHRNSIKTTYILFFNSFIFPSPPSYHIQSRMDLPVSFAALFSALSLHRSLCLLHSCPICASVLLLLLLFVVVVVLCVCVYLFSFNHRSYSF